MSINLTGDIRYDSRGLPEGYDPHKFYEYQRDTLITTTTGLESFIYKYIPWSVIKSFAIAIDPTAPFKVSPGTITAANRTKYRLTASVLQKRLVRELRVRKGKSWGPNFHISACWNPAPTETLSITNTTGSQPDQSPLADYLKDTTGRTRLFGSSQGELEFFKAYINSPPRTISTGYERDDDIITLHPPEPICQSFGGISNPGVRGSDISTITISPTGGWLPIGTYNALRTSEIAYCKALSQKHAVSLLKEWSPEKRDYSIFRNVVELRDLPRSVLSLKDTLGDLRKLFVSLGTQPKLRKSIFDLKSLGSHVPDEYLSYHFGWKQTYKDLMDLLALPEKLAKRFNFVNARNGKPTTFRLKRQVSSAESDISGFGYSPLNGEFSGVLKTRLERESELRLVISAVFDFPPLNGPSFRSDHFLERIGAIPRVTDIYNLIPWTWLVDWFTGLGNYVELIEQINHDSSLINWGMLTCHTNGKLISTWDSKSALKTRVKIDGVSSQTERVVSYTHTSELIYECQTRIDVSKVLSVKQTSVPGSLSLYQKSILGALLSQRNQHFRGT